MTQTPKIVIAGASGYIGRAVIAPLLAKFPHAEITALSRTKLEHPDPRVTWRGCDLFSLKSLEAAMPTQVDLALYLVHSMGPTAHLDQGGFADYDLLLADNFARALKKTGVQQLIYLTGIIPEDTKLSLHLQSRLEAEQTFAQHKMPTTIFRAGLILGPGGSSSQILLKLVSRLPVMVCPSWTQTLTSPVDLETVLKALCDAALDTNTFHKVYDLAGCPPLTYVQMMQLTARAMHKRRQFLSVPFFTPTLSRLWVSVITGSPKQLVYPLVESLKHPMVARPSHTWSGAPKYASYSELIQHVPLEIEPKRALFRFRPPGRTVRSVQRLPLPPGRNASWVKDLYISWLPQFFAPLIKVRVTGTSIFFSVLFSKPVLLELHLSEERSDPDRQLFYIIRGALVAVDNRGRLEFRVVLDRQYLIAAIHDYVPALPWFVYKATQARVHLMVMRAFARRLRKA